jgi:hypothetical protein
VCRFRRPGRLAAALWVAFLVAVFGLMVKSSPTSSFDLDSVLLDADEIDDVIGTSGSEVLDEGNAPDDTTEVNPPRCHGVVYIAGEIEYVSTNFTAMRWRIVGAANASVVEMVAQLPSVAEADEFIDKQTKAWEGCADEIITTKDKVGTSTTQDRVTAVRARPRTVIASTLPLSSRMPCQHVLQAVSNFVLEACPCGNNASDQAEAIASKLADRVRSG